MMYTFRRGKSHSDYYQWMDAGSSFDVQSDQFDGSTFRIGRSPEATLFEASRDNGKLWHDISVIPPDCGNGRSWEECSKGGKVKGFNVAVSVERQDLVPVGAYNCPKLLNCQWEKCAEAYLFPFDDIHTKSCSKDEALLITWCASPNPATQM
ncbi:hypothetical protein SPRG_17096 [Saprolegnia parasitica CBS 223.65]|uniref:Uncharacterized protein n=1 Tax=Saprolegnia parasitica (strain CBS 223.65) TaxID=695850 RepID=A0A067BL79_SAPPC|nr:hypothetical protein SPRG_17096 [Saprolegnia parasitica CBS 223.65]KDO17490.1 hypothetical protein SPRG_17096 [Saprolegnia parasitica CBS 223.65]|eukprot:XP_012211807.1 hypothetical protein SPRG_17096 [Saprolegnia parasitica CBS 223.65]